MDVALPVLHGFVVSVFFFSSFGVCLSGFGFSAVAVSDVPSVRGWDFVTGCGGHVGREGGREGDIVQVL